MKVKLSDICLMQSGGTPKRSNLTFYNGNIPWITISDFKNASGDVILKTEENITESGLQSINNRLFKKGTLLLAMYGSIGKTVITGIEASTNQAILAINPKDEKVLNVKFLKYWFEHNKDFIYSQGKGAALQNISLAIVKRQEIELPNRETQDKIVSLLDKVKSLIEKREKTITSFDNLLNAVFLDVFGDPILNTKSWEVSTLRNILTKIDAGWSPVCEEKPRQNSSQLAILKQGAVSKRFFIPEQNKILPEGINIKKAIYAKKGDILFSRKNTKELVGSTVLIFDDFENLLLPDTIFNLRFKKNKITATYLFVLFNNIEFRKKIQELSTGQVESMSNISQEKLFKLEIPLPPFKLMQNFEIIVLKINNNLKKINKSKDGLENLINSLYQRTFNDNFIYDIDVELDALINSVDLKRNDKDNDISTIMNDITFLQRLLDKLNDREFENIDLYDKAKYIVFRIMNEEKDLVEQKFDKENNNIKLILK